MVTINRKLNLVIPLERGDKTKLYIHSVPLRTEAFEKYHLVLAKTFSALSGHGLDPRSGPSVASLILKETAQNTMRVPGMNWYEGPDGVGGESGLLSSIMQMSNAVVCRPERGWGTMPLSDALRHELIDEEEKSEALNLLVFFTVVSLVAPRVDRERLVRGMAIIYELETTSFNATEFATSLKMPTIEGNIGENETQS